MKNWKLWAVVILSILIVGLFFGIRFAGILGVIGVGGAAYSKKEKAKENVDKAGDDVEGKHHDNANSAANKLDDVLDDSSE